jgi:hypothetical protein
VESEKLPATVDLDDMRNGAQRWAQAGVSPV